MEINKNINCFVIKYLYSIRKYLYKYFAKKTGFAYAFLNPYLKENKIEDEDLIEDTIQLI